jgi:HK97 family phage portal protein
MEVAAGSIQSASSLDAFSGSFFRNGMQPSGILEVPPTVKLSAEAFASLEAKFLSRHQGSGNSGRPLILDGGMTYKQTSTDPEKAQLLDTRKLSVYELCRWFGVPPYLAFASEQQPRANVETQSREFFSYCLLPIIKASEQQADRKLLNRRLTKLYTQMNTDQLLRGDYTTLAAYYQTMRNIGVFTINDVLRMEGLDTIGAEGDIRHMQVQNQPVSGLNSEEKPNPQVNTAEKAEDAKDL